MKHFFIAVFSFFIQAAYGQAGTLDVTFGSGGKVMKDVGLNMDDGIFALAIQPDGKIVAGGYYYTGSGAINKFALMRYNTNGTLDNTFNLTGKVTISNAGGIITTVKLQPDGKILAAGDGYIVRYLSSGTIDNTFGSNGILNTGTSQTERIDLQPDGKIVGVSRNRIISRYTELGKADSTFGINGVLQVDTTNFDIARQECCIALQADSKIVITGTMSIASKPYYFIYRCNASGVTDTNFGTAGWVVCPTTINPNEGSGLLLQPDDKILQCSTSRTSSGNTNALLSRLNSDGSFDTTFGSNGIAELQYGANVSANEMVLQPDGKIYFTGYAITQPAIMRFLIARVNANGTPDNTFASDGYTLTQVSNHPAQTSTSYCIALQADGKVILGGQAVNLNSGGYDDFALARYYTANVSGVEKADDSRVSLYPNPASNTLYLLSDNLYIEQVQIFNTNSQVMIQDALNTTQLDISSLPNGIYIATLKNKESYIIKRFVKM